MSRDQYTGLHSLLSSLFPCNAGNAARTTERVKCFRVPVSRDTGILRTWNIFTRAAQEGTSVGFRRVRVSVCARISLLASADLLSSVFAFDWLACCLLLSAEKADCQGRVSFVKKTWQVSNMTGQVCKLGIRRYGVNRRLASASGVPLWPCAFSPRLSRYFIKRVFLRVAAISASKSSSPFPM